MTCPVTRSRIRLGLGGPPPGPPPAAMRLCFTSTHNVAEGAGVAALAAAWQERERLKGLKVGLILSGANVDREVFAEQLAAGD